jgi:hypothetical protein
MILFLAVLSLALAVAPAVYGQEGEREVRDWAPPGERQGWFAPSRPGEIGDYLADLARSFESVELDTLAWADGGSAEPDSALPVLHVGVRRPAPEDRERIRVLVLAGQRGDDLSGPEVSLQLLRELVVGELSPLLDDLEFAFVPAVNPWGLLWWMPEDPTGIDPARDHALMRSEATRAVHGLASRWRPHLVIELRETSPSVYRVQAGLPKHPNAHPELATFGRFYLLPYVANELIRTSVSFREQVAVGPDSEVRGTPLNGADGLPEGGYLTPGPLGADRARNSFALSGALPIMLAVASLEGVEGLVDRIQVLYQSAGYLLEVAAAHGDILRERTEAARRGPHPRTPSSGDEAPTALSLRHAYESDETQPDLVWLVWSEGGHRVTQNTDRWRSAVRRQLVLPVPAAWVIEPQGREWAELVAAHGFTVERLEHADRMEVGSYPIGTIARLPPDLADDLPLDSAPDGSTLLVWGERPVPEGSWLVRAEQPGARLLFTLIEPWSEDAPFSRENAPRSIPADSVTYPLYPVHRVEAGAPIESLRTGPADFSPARPGGTD